MRGLALLLLLFCSWSRAEHFRVHRRGLLDVLGDIVNGNPSSSSPSSSSDTATSSSSVPPSGITSAVPPTSVAADPPSSSSSPGPVGLLLGDQSSSSTGGGILGNILQGPSSTPPPDPTSTPPPDPSSTPPVDPSSSSSQGGGILGDILQGPSSTPPPDPTSTPPPDPSSIPPVDPSSTSTQGGGLLGNLLGPSSTPPPPDPSSTPPPDSSSTPAPSSTGGGLLPALGGLLQGPSSTPSPDSSTPAPAPSSTGGPVPILDPLINPSSADGGGLTSAIPPTSVLLPVPGTSEAPPPPSPSSDSPIIGFPSTPIIPPPASSSDAPPPPPPPSSDPPNALPTFSSPPTPTPEPSTPPPPPPSPPPSSPPPARPTPSNSVSINSDLSFVLTESSLAVASLPSSTPATGDNVLTDPDAATTTVTNTLPLSAPSPSSVFVSAADPSKDSPAQPPLPSGVPSRIYPATQQVDPHATQDDMRKDGYTLISLLFDQKLNWMFVINNGISSSQIFAYIPPLIATAIGESTDQVKTLFLQVFVPLSYDSPSDQGDLGTLWVGYIPTDQVDTLEAMIKAKQSKFYTAVPIEAARQLAERVKIGWTIRGAVGVGDDASSSSSGGGGSSSGGNSGSGTNANQQKARRDAIIGVVSSLGAIALLVLVVLIVHSVKRRRELAHRRLADRSSSVGSSGEDVGGAAAQGVQSGGREFDRDSVGAPRRRSFYFAEDSLRGWEAEREHEREFNEFGSSAGPSPTGGMSQRKVGPVVVPGSISAPILRESSMNW